MVTARQDLAGGASSGMQAYGAMKTGGRGGSYLVREKAPQRFSPSPTPTWQALCRHSGNMRAMLVQKKGKGREKRRQAWAWDGWRRRKKEGTAEGQGGRTGHVCWKNLYCLSIISLSLPPLYYRALLFPHRHPRRGTLRVRFVACVAAA